MRLDALTAERDFHTANGEQGRGTNIVTLALRYGPCRLVLSVIDDFHLEGAVKRDDTWQVSLSTEVNLDFPTDTDCMRRVSRICILHDAEDCILRVVLHERFQHADRIGGAAASRIVLRVL